MLNANLQLKVGILIWKKQVESRKSQKNKSNPIFD